MRNTLPIALTRPLEHISNVFFGLTFYFYPYDHYDALWFPLKYSETKVTNDQVTPIHSFLLFNHLDTLVQIGGVTRPNTGHIYNQHRWKILFKYF